MTSRLRSRPPTRWSSLLVHLGRSNLSSHLLLKRVVLARLLALVGKGRCSSRPLVLKTGTRLQVELRLARADHGEGRLRDHQQAARLEQPCQLPQLIKSFRLTLGCHRNPMPLVLVQTPRLKVCPSPPLVGPCPRMTLLRYRRQSSEGAAGSAPPRGEVPWHLMGSEALLGIRTKQPNISPLPLAHKGRVFQAQCRAVVTTGEVGAPRLRGRVQWMKVAWQEPALWTPAFLDHRAVHKVGWQRAKMTCSS